ncbi:MAG: hypothetical protein WCI22_05925, partial [Actinomycetota bacterium]
MVDRIVMTLLSVGVIWAVISGFVMFWKRRRKGTLGTPRRPVDVKFAKRLTIILCAVAIAFPPFGVTAVIILCVDKFVI